MRRPENSAAVLHVVLSPYGEFRMNCYLVSEKWLYMSVRFLTSTVSAQNYNFCLQVHQSCQSINIAKMDATPNSPQKP